MTGVYLHGLAGGLAAAGGQEGMLAGDIAAKVPVAIQVVQAETGAGR